VEYRLGRAGGTVVAFLHDAVVAAAGAGADAAAVERQSDGITVDTLRALCPDVAIELEGTCRRRGAKSKGDEIVRGG
jgi:hypothetical protein